MKTKSIILLLVALFCISLTACGSEEVKRPIDYPDTKWTCESANASFTVSAENKIVAGTLANNSGEKASVSFSFSDMSEGKVSITSVDGTETYLSGTCTYEAKKCTIMISDVYNSDFSNVPIRMVFERSDA